MKASNLKELKELNKNKVEISKVAKTYIVINPLIPSKSGEDITEKIKKIYNFSYMKFCK